MEILLIPFLKAVILLPATLLPIINPLSTAPVFVATVGSDGRLYGATRHGGATDAGTVFSVRLNGTGFAIVRSFSTNANDGVNATSAARRPPPTPAAA